MTLRAKLPILYASTQYGVGDELPAHNADLVAAWLESGAAYWDGVESRAEAPKAKAVTAEAGLGGNSSDGDPEALVGKVPKRGRTKK